MREFLQHMRLDARRITWVVLALVGALMVSFALVAVVIATVTIVQVRETQVDIKPTIDTTGKTLDLLVDCTQPPGECYARNQENTQGAIVDIGKYSVYAAACADRPRQQTVIQIQRCIEELVLAETSD